MTRTRKDEAPIEIDRPVAEGRYVELDEWPASVEIGMGAITDLQATPAIVRKFVDWLETTHVPDGLFADGVFLDFTPPQWRLQARGVQATVAIRQNGHPAPGRVPRLRYDPTPSGFVLEWEEEWDENGDHWYCREMMRAELRDGAISDVSVYCTGDWSSAHRDRHAHEVRLLRP